MPQPAILEELDAPEDTLLMAFGSMRLERPVPPFEFRGAFKGIPAKKIFVRDPFQLWYQKGLPGIADSIEGVGSYLKRLVAEQEVNKVVTFGGSMGGYAALYFGWYLAADEVYSFSPKTFLSPLKRVAHGDFRWKRLCLTHPINRKLAELLKQKGIDRRNLDLQGVLRHPNFKSKYHVYYSPHHRLDRLHAERMADVVGMQIITYEPGGHHILNHMKKSGFLEQLIRTALAN